MMKLNEGILMGRPIDVGGCAAQNKGAVLGVLRGVKISKLK